MNTPRTRRGGPFDGLPVTVSVAKLIENGRIAESMANKRRAGAGGSINFHALAQLPPSAAPEAGSSGSRPMNKAQREAQMRHESYLVEDPTPSSIDLTNNDLAGYMRLECMEISGYDANPRLYENEAREEIKQSLIASGFQGAFVVTRRGPGQPYMLARGSNTTLDLVQELFQQGDQRFRWVSCLFEPYKDEVKILAQHLGENLNRGGMRFWEVAKGVADLLTQIEAKRAAEGSTATLSTREASEALLSEGIKLERTAVAVLRFAVARLSSLGPATACLKRDAVSKQLQPRLLELESLGSRFGLNASDFWRDVADPAMRHIGDQYGAGSRLNVDVVDIAAAVEAALAANLQEPPASLAQMLNSLRLNPDATAADLRVPSPNMVVAPASQRDQGEQATVTPAADASQQRLSLGPTVIRDASKASTSVDSGTPRLQPAAAPSSTKPLAAPVTPSSAQLTFGIAEEHGPTLALLHEALEAVTNCVGLRDTLVFHRPMPLGYFLDLPDPARHRRAVVELDSAEDQLRHTKAMVWWTLVSLSGQWTNGAVDCVDHDSLFFRHHSEAGADAANPMAGLDTEQEPQGHEALMRRVTPGPYREAMHLLRRVETLMAEVYEAEPARWAHMQRLQLSNSPY